MTPVDHQLREQRELLRLLALAHRRLTERQHEHIKRDHSAGCDNCRIASDQQS